MPLKFGKHHRERKHSNLYRNDKNRYVDPLTHLNHWLTVPAVALLVRSRKWISAASSTALQSGKLLVNKMARTQLFLLLNFALISVPTLRASSIRFVIPLVFAAPQRLNASSSLVLGYWALQGQRESCDQVFTGEIELAEMPLEGSGEWSC